MVMTRITVARTGWWMCILDGTEEVYCSSSRLQYDIISIANAEGFTKRTVGPTRIGETILTARYTETSVYVLRETNFYPNPAYSDA